MITGKSYISNIYYIANLVYRKISKHSPITESVIMINTEAIQFFAEKIIIVCWHSRYYNYWTLYLCLFIGALISHVTKRIYEI